MRQPSPRPENTHKQISIADLSSDLKPALNQPGAEGLLGVGVSAVPWLLAVREVGRPVHKEALRMCRGFGVGAVRVAAV